MVLYDVREIDGYYIFNYFCIMDTEYEHESDPWSSESTPND